MYFYPWPGSVTGLGGMGTCRLSETRTANSLLFWQHLLEASISGPSGRLGGFARICSWACALLVPQRSYAAPGATLTPTRPARAQLLGGSLWPARARVTGCQPQAAPADAVKATDRDAFGVTARRPGRSRPATTNADASDGGWRMAMAGCCRAARLARWAACVCVFPFAMSLAGFPVWRMQTPWRVVGPMTPSSRCCKPSCWDLSSALGTVDRRRNVARAVE